MLKLHEEATITARAQGNEEEGEANTTTAASKPATARDVTLAEGEKVKPSAQLVLHLKADCSELYNPGHSFPALDPIGERVEGSGPLLRE